MQVNQTDLDLLLCAIYFFSQYLRDSLDIFLGILYRKLSIYVMDEALKALTDRLAAIETRLDALPRQGASSSTDHTGSPLPAGVSTSGRSVDVNTNNPDPTGDSTQGAFGEVNIQREFEQVRDVVSRIQLPAHLKVNDSATGINKECKATLKVLNKSARFAETGLKVLASAPSPRLSEQEVHMLYTVLHAQINFLQGEYSSLVVRSTFDDETSRVFRSLESNSTAFSERSLNNVRLAAELTSIRARATANRPPNRPSQQSNSRRNFQSGGGFTTFRGRGGYHRGTPWPRIDFPSQRPDQPYDADHP